jgi:hypothetical protein
MKTLTTTPCAASDPATAQTVTIPETPAGSDIDLQEVRRQLVPLWFSWSRLHPVPPNWSHSGWKQEFTAIAWEAVWVTACEVCPTNDPAFTALACHRAMTSVQKRYRQEWRFATRFMPLAARLWHRRDLEPANDEPPNCDTESSRLSWVREWVRLLPAAGRWLIHQLFYLGRTEREVANQLNMSQSAVHKHKAALIADARAKAQKEV